MEPDTTTLDDAMLLEPPVSVLRGWIAISLGVFLVATCGIVVAGYPALEIILIDSGAFHYLCEGTEPCEAQNLRLALMFILAISSLNCCLFFIGPLLNYLGPRNLGMIGACILILGDLLIAFGDEDTMYFYQWGYLAGYPLLGIAGSIVLFCILHLANIFQQHRGKVITVFIATGESAAIVFLLFKLMYDHLGLSLKQLFLIHIIFPGMFFVYCIFFEPDRTYKPPQFGDIKEYYYSRKMPIIRQFKSPQFILFSIWGCISLTANYFYLTNIKDELYWRTGDTAFTTLGQELVTIFLGTFTIIIVPITGTLLDKFGTGKSMFFLAGIQTFFTVLSQIPNKNLQIFTLCVYTFWRMSLFSVWTHAANVLFGDVSNVVAFTFGLAGLVNFSNYGWTALTLGPLRGDFLPPNLIFGALCTLTTVGIGLLFECWKIPHEETALLYSSNS